MGAGQSTEAFSIHLAELKTRTIDINDHDYWGKLFTQKMYHLDVFDTINERDITILRIRRPENLAILIFKCIEQIHLFSQETNLANTTGDRQLSVITSLVFLSRCLPYILFRIDASAYKPNTVSEYAPDFAMHLLVNNMMCMREQKKEKNSTAQPQQQQQRPSAVAVGNDDDDAANNNDVQPQTQEAENDEEPAHLVFPFLEDRRPLGDTMIRAITRAGFVPGFTVGAKQAPLANLQESFKPEMLKELTHAYLHPESMWKGGISSQFISGSTLATEQAAINRSLVVRALMAAFSSQAYAANGNQPARLRYFFCDPRENPLSQTLVASMLSIVCAYNPYGSLPYTSHLVTQEEALVADCLSCLSIIFDTSIFHQELPRESEDEPRRLISQDAALTGHSAWNFIDNLQETPSDFDTIASGLLRLLNNNAYSRMTYLPGSQRVLPFRDEIFILLWKFAYKSRAFRKTFCKQPQWCKAIVVPMITLLIDGIDNNGTRASMLQLAVMMMETFSMERDFALALNEPFLEYTPFKLPAWQGTYFDLMVWGVQNCLACRNRAALSMHHAALCTIANMAPCATSISMLSSMKLMQLFEQYSKKEWLDSQQPPDHMLSVLLYLIASSMQYEFSGSTHLAYALLRRSSLVKSLWDYIRLRSVASDAPADATPPAPPVDGEDTEDEEEEDEEDEERTNKKKEKSAAAAASAAASTAQQQQPKKPTRPRFNRSILTHIFTLKCTVEALESVTLKKLEQDPNFDVHSMLENITLVGKMPVPHPLLIHRVPESPEIDHWITSVVWSTVNSRSTLNSRPVLHPPAIRLFARPQPVQHSTVSSDDDSELDEESDDDDDTGSTPDVGKSDSDHDHDDEEMKEKNENTNSTTASAPASTTSSSVAVPVPTS